MELQFQESEVRCLDRILDDVRRMELTQEIRLSDGMPDIGRVLTAWGQIQLRSKEWNREDIRISGGVMVWVLYLPEDGTEPRCVESWLPMQIQMEVPAGPEGIIRVFPLLRSVDGRGTSARKIMVRVNAAASVQALRRSERKLYSPGEVPENVELLKRTYPLRIPREAGERVFLLDEEPEFPDSGEMPEKILSYSFLPVVTEQRITGDKLAFKGKGKLHLSFRSAEGKVRSRELEIPFSQIAELDGSHSENAGAEVLPAVTSLEVSGPEEGKLRMKAGLVAQYLVDDRFVAEVTEDAYSPFRDVAVREEKLQLPAILEDREETVAARQTLTGHSGEVADVSFYPDFPREKRRSDGVEFELSGVFQVLFYGPDGSLRAGSAPWEGRVKLPADENTIVASQIHSLDAETVPSEDITAAARMKLRLRSMAPTAVPMVTALDLGEHRDPDPGRPSLILCRPGEDALWDIAKRCGSTVAAIRCANDLREEPEPDRMLLIPVT